MCELAAALGTSGWQRFLVCVEAMTPPLKACTLRLFKLASLSSQKVVGDNTCSFVLVLAALHALEGVGWMLETVLQVKTQFLILSLFACQSFGVIGHSDVEQFYKYDVVAQHDKPDVTIEINDFNVVGHRYDGGSNLSFCLGLIPSKV